MRYIQQNLNIKIYIAKTDIDANDKVKLYETTDDVSNGVLLAILSASESDEENPSIENYLFQYSKRITTPNIYSFYYTVSDTAGNESAVVSSFNHVVCLTPVTPDALTINDINNDTITFNL